MIPSNQEKLDEMYELVLENNDILRGMRSRERLSNIFKIIYWVFILGAIFGVYYYLEPVIKVFTNNMTSLQSGIEKLNTASNSLPEVNTIKNLFNSFKK
jgi:hypothetical protein